MDPRVEDWESFEEFSMESEESSYGCPDSHCDHTVAGRLPVGFWLVLVFFCLCICLCLCCITKKRDQIENLEMIERQDEEAMHMNDVNNNNPAVYYAQQPSYGQPQSN